MCLNHFQSFNSLICHLPAYLFPDITVLKVRFVLQNFKKSFKGNFCLSLFNFQGASHLIPMIFIIFRFRRSSVPQVSFAIISNPSPFVNPIFSSFLSFLLPFFNTPGCCFCPLVFSCLFSSVPLLYILRWGWGWALYVEIKACLDFPFRFVSVSIIFLLNISIFF